MYPIMDETGKVAQWIKDGRGVRVWESHDIGAGRPDMLTPGDVETPPHWAYPLSGSKVVTDPVFFQRTGVVKSWTDTPAGLRAAERYLGAMSYNDKNEERDAPIGKVFTRYSIERHFYSTEAIVSMPHGDRPLDVEYRVCVVRWTAIIKS